MATSVMAAERHHNIKQKVIAPFSLSTKYWMFFFAIKSHA